MFKVTTVLATIVLATVLVLAIAAPVAAQDTRAGVIQTAQADRQSTTTPSQPNRAERIIERLEDWGLFDGAPRGLYPWIGSAYPGSGVTLGAGLRQTFADDGVLNTFGGYSLSRSSRVEGALALPTFAQKRARVTLSGQYIDAAEVEFFGVGNSSAQTDLMYYGFTPKRAGVQLEVDPGAKLSLGGGVSYLAIDTSSGRIGPANVDYVNSSVRAAFDWRRPLGYSGSGGAYRLQFDDFRQRANRTHSFRSVEAEALQLLPVLRANWVIALRGLATLTDTGVESDIPYFMLPALGGGGTLRGYPDFRFRDRHRLLMSAELRWTPARFLDMAIFYDTGKVASRRQDLDFDDLNDSYGIGARIVATKGYVLRVEVARSREHAARLLVKAGGGF